VEEKILTVCHSIEHFVFRLLQKLLQRITKLNYHFHYSMLSEPNLAHLLS